jgi:hypothetical protein
MDLLVRLPHILCSCRHRHAAGSHTARLSLRNDRDRILAMSSMQQVYDRWRHQ